MIEAFVLAILEKVLSQYVGDVLTKRRSERTRAEVIASVKSELSRIGDVEKQVDALTVAVRELDCVVTTDKYLKWQGDVLAVEAPRRIMSRKQPEPEAAIEQLRASVSQRRRELERTYSQEEQRGTMRVVEEDQGDLTHGVPDTPRQLSPWQERVLGLSSDIRRERRRTQDND